ncbi:MAG: M20/M25/M40 family metallo-hydrolase [Pirellulaceae bacterium]
MSSSETALSILKQLIAIPSQNPMGHEPVGSGWLEAGMSNWLRQFFTSHSIPHEYHEIEPERGNVVAFLAGEPERPTILLDAHQDTVPVAGMTIEPYAPVESRGRLYGRGACDVKGSMAVILSVLLKLKASRQKHAPVLVSLTCDEERTQKGAADLVRRLHQPENERSPLLRHRPAMAIVSEPTDLNVVVAHKGTVRWKIKTHGIAAHSSDPSKEAVRSTRWPTSSKFWNVMQT